MSSVFLSPHTLISSGARPTGGRKRSAFRGPLLLDLICALRREEIQVKGARGLRGLRTLDRFPPFAKMGKKGKGGRGSQGACPLAEYEAAPHARGARYRRPSPACSPCAVWIPFC